MVGRQKRGLDRTPSLQIPKTWRKFTSETHPGKPRKGKTFLATTRMSAESMSRPHPSLDSGAPRIPRQRTPTRRVLQLEKWKAQKPSNHVVEAKLVSHRRK